MLVHHGVVKRESAVVVVDRRERERAIFVEVHLTDLVGHGGLIKDLDRAAHGNRLAGDRRNRELFALGIAVVGTRVEGHRGVFRGADHVRVGHRRVVVAVIDRDVHPALVALLPVAHGIREFHRAGVARLRRHGQLAVEGQGDLGNHHGTRGVLDHDGCPDHDRCAIDRRHGERLTVRITVVGKHIHRQRLPRGCQTHIGLGARRVIGAQHLDGERGRAAPSTAIGHRVGEPLLHTFAIVQCPRRGVGHIAVRTVGIQGQTAIVALQSLTDLTDHGAAIRPTQAHCDNPQAVAIGIAVLTRSQGLALDHTVGRRHDQGCIFAGLIDIRLRLRQGVALPADIDGHPALVGHPTRIGCGVAERDRTGVTRSGGHLDPPISRHLERRHRGARLSDQADHITRSHLVAVDGDQSERIAIGINVVAQHVHRHGHTCRRVRDVVVDHRRVIHRLDRHIDRGSDRCGAIGHRVFERDRTHVAGLGLERELAIGPQGDRTLTGQCHRLTRFDRVAIDLGDDQIVIVGVAVVSQYVDDDELAFVGRHLVIGCRRRHVVRTHRHGHQTDVPQATRVLDRVFERDRPLKAFGGRERQRAIFVAYEGAFARDRDPAGLIEGHVVDGHDGQCALVTGIGILVVAQHVDHHGLTGLRPRHIIDGHRAIGGAQQPDGQRGLRDPALAVGHRVTEEVFNRLARRQLQCRGVGCIAEGTICTQDQRAVGALNRRAGIGVQRAIDAHGHLQHDQSIPVRVDIRADDLRGALVFNVACQHAFGRGHRNLGHRALDVVGVCLRDRRVIDADSTHRQIGRGRVAGRIRDGVGEQVLCPLTLGQGDRGIAGHIGVGAVGVERQGTKLTHQRLTDDTGHFAETHGRDGQGVAEIRVRVATGLTLDHAVLRRHHQGLRRAVLGKIDVGLVILGHGRTVVIDDRGDAGAVNDHGIGRRGGDDDREGLVRLQALVVHDGNAHLHRALASRDDHRARDRLEVVACRGCARLGEEGDRDWRGRRPAQGDGEHRRAGVFINHDVIDGDLCRRHSPRNLQLFVTAEFGAGQTPPRVELERLRTDVLAHAINPQARLQAAIGTATQTGRGGGVELVVLDGGDGAVDVIARRRHRLDLGHLALGVGDLDDAVLGRDDLLARLDLVADLQRLELATGQSDIGRAPQAGDGTRRRFGEDGHGRSTFGECNWVRLYGHFGCAKGGLHPLFRRTASHFEGSERHLSTPGT